VQKQPSKSVTRKMDPLSIVEKRLGPVVTWPTCVVEDMFITEPHVCGLREVATFMYRNVVPTDVSAHAVVVVRCTLVKSRTSGTTCGIGSRTVGTRQFIIP
jgi:hypothetical protein